jgi:hypothetical protein
MSIQPIPGESSLPTSEDSRKRDILSKIILTENQVVVDFAKHLVTISFSAIAIILTLKEKWLTNSKNLHVATALLGTAMVLFLAAVLVSTIAIRAYRLRVSSWDYSDIEHELSRIARRRYLLTLAATTLCILATALVVIAIL